MASYIHWTGNVRTACAFAADAPVSYPPMTVLFDGAELLIDWFVLLTYQLS